MKLLSILSEQFQSFSKYSPCEMDGHEKKKKKKQRKIAFKRREHRNILYVCKYSPVKNKKDKRTRLEKLISQPERCEWIRFFYWLYVLFIYLFFIRRLKGKPARRNSASFWKMKISHDCNRTNNWGRINYRYNLRRCNIAMDEKQDCKKCLNINSPRLIFE